MYFFANLFQSCSIQVDDNDDDDFICELLSEIRCDDCTRMIVRSIESKI